MKVSKNIWVKNKLGKQLIYSRRSGNIFSRLLCTCFLGMFISGCNFWPDSSERVLSISHRAVTLPPGVDYEHLTHLLEVSKKRYVELKNAGAGICLPGQMLKVSKKQNLVKHELDGNLLFDAHFHLKDIFSHLFNIKNQVENNNPSRKCYEFFADSNDGIVHKIGSWENSVEIDDLMEDRE